MIIHTFGLCMCADLPPPPELPPLTEDPLKHLTDIVDNGGSRTAPQNRERRSERRTAAQWSAEGQTLGLLLLLLKISPKTPT